MKNKILISLISLVCSTGFSQEVVTWNDLAAVKFEKKFFPVYNEFFLYPHFSSSVKAIRGKTITITGYFLDIDPEDKIFLLSKGPMSSCFFCGIGGPESAIELHFPSKPPFKMDDVITVTGILELNSEDVDHLNYILNECESKLAK